MTRTLIAVGAALAALPAAATASHVAGAPANDDYLQSTPFNNPGERLPRDSTLSHTGDTTAATVQPDLFNPQADMSPGSGGGAELTSCGGVSYGKTVWYDFYPHVAGVARIRVNATGAGLDPHLAAIPFDRKTARPAFGRAQCANVPGPSEELFASVGRGGSYTIQLGGAGDTGGAYQILFDFLPDTDGDGRLDEIDRCPTRPGVVNGCPRRLDRQVRTPFAFASTADGVRLRFLKVDAPRKTRVDVRCTHGACSHRALETVARAARTLRLRFLTGRRLRAGTKIEIRVTQRNAVGAYVRFLAGRGTLKKTTRCMNPGSRIPRKRCR